MAPPTGAASVSKSFVASPLPPDSLSHPIATRLAESPILLPPGLHLLPLSLSSFLSHHTGVWLFLNMPRCVFESGPLSCLFSAWSLFPHMACSGASFNSLNKCHFPTNGFPHYPIENCKLPHNWHSLLYFSHKALITIYYTI